MSGKDTLLPSDNTVAAYWITNPDNSFVGNVAAEEVEDLHERDESVVDDRPVGFGFLGTNDLGLHRHWATVKRLQRHPQVRGARRDPNRGVGPLEALPRSPPYRRRRDRSPHRRPLRHPRGPAAHR